jgi:hypothetical protein
MPDEQESASLLHYALDNGVNLIDTGHAYGASERLIGAAIGSRCDKSYIVSKVTAPPEQAGEIRRQVEQSLRHLRTGMIDVLLALCRATELMPRIDMIDEFEQLRCEGIVRFIGASIYGPEAALACIRNGRLDCLRGWLQPAGPAAGSGSIRGRAAARYWHHRPVRAAEGSIEPPLSVAAGHVGAVEACSGADGAGRRLPG